MEVRNRLQELEQRRDALIAGRKELAERNAMSERIIGFSAAVGSNIDQLDFDQRQKLLRLVVDQVRVRGWRVDIRLRIPWTRLRIHRVRNCTVLTVYVPLIWITPAR